MKLEAEWLGAPGPQAVMTLLGSAGHAGYFVGGCVRNSLLSVPVSDIDIATDARPETVTALAEAQGFNVVATGIEHGTVTILAHDAAFEVTTFRRDVATDGRRAVVAYSSRIEDDAMRRDFTINALYADASGAVLDPTGQGLADLAARRWRFVGRAEDRITEDYLRILRFFRFHAWYGDPEVGFEANTIAAIAEHRAGLGQISAERIGQEMRKLLAAPDPSPELATMGQTGVLMQVLPGANGANAAPLIHIEREIGLAPDPLVRLAALGAESPADALRLTRAEAKRLGEIRAAIASSDGPGALGYQLGAASGRGVLVLRAALLSQPVGARDLAQIDQGARAQFPVRAADLPDTLRGPDIGQRLRTLESAWIESGFRLGRDDLLALP
ncbi:MAG: CCA tRNA nucleotidyltransferase [Pseudomonadota bacterium]